MSCDECVRLWRFYKFGLVQRHRLNRKLTSAIGASDLPNFEALSRELTETEAGLGFLRDEMDKHKNQTGHNPRAEPVGTSGVSVPNQPQPSHGETLPVGARVVLDMQAIRDDMPPGPSASQVERPTHDHEGGICEEKRRLLDEFLQAVHELNALQDQQAQAVMAGDSDFSRFDVLLHMALQKKENAKYAWMVHVETHRCKDA